MSNIVKLNIFLFIFLLHSFIIGAKETPLSKTQVISFKENKGQVGDQFSKSRTDILFTGNSGNLVFHLRNNGVSYQTYRVDKWKKITKEDAHSAIHRSINDKIPEQTTVYRLDIDWVGANESATVKKQDQLPGYENYYTEVCPNGVLGVQSYKSVVYQNLYEGINLKWYEKNGSLKYDYIVAPGADHSKIKLNIKGAKKLSINKNGELIIETPLGTLTEQAPLVLQGGRKLKAKWLIQNSMVSFDIVNVDPSQELIIDPLVRLWGTFYGGNLEDALWYTFADAIGNTYSSGASESTNNIATSGAHQTAYGGNSSAWWGDAVLVKFNSAGVRLWATYYGGSGGDFANLCAGDNSGNYVAMVGGTTSTLTGVISTPGSHQSNYAGSTSSNMGDAFLVLFDNAGVRQWGTYYGGSGDDWGGGCTFDGAGNIYLSGQTDSSNPNIISTPGSHQPTFGGGFADGFLAKFNNSGTRIWGTYYGGAVYDCAYTCTVDAVGNSYLVGSSTSPSGISSLGAYQPVYGGGSSWWGDAFIAKFDGNGLRQWSTYYGGTGDDWAYNCVLDASANIYIAGTTSAASQTVISTSSSHQPAFGGGVSDAFLLKLNAAGARQWCTFYGGSSTEDYSYCSIDPSGNIYVAGISTSTNSISTPCAYQPNYSGGVGDAYLVKFDPTGLRLWGTYYGGAGTEKWCICSTDQLGNVYITGQSNSAAGIITSSGSHQTIYGGGSFDGFLVKFDGCIPLAPPNTTNPSSLTICSGKSTVLTTSISCGVNWYNVAIGGTPLAGANIFITPLLAINTTYYIEELSCGTNSVRTAVTITVAPAPTFSIAANPTVMCVASSATLIPLGATNGFTWTANSSLNASIPSSAIATPINTQTYYLIGDNGVCIGSGSVVINVIPTPTVDLGNQLLYVCAGKSATLTALGAVNYTWSPAGSLNTPNGAVVIASPNSNTTYTVIGSNTYSNVTCSDQKNLTIYVVPYLTNATVSESVAVCLGQLATLIASGGSIHTWWPIDNMDDPNAAEVHVSSPVSTVYSVNISNNGLCPVTRTVLVQVNPLPIVDAGRDTTFNINEPMYIAAVGSGTLSWIDGPSIYCKNCPMTQVFPTKSTCYTVKATNEFGCTVNDQICIEITQDHLIYVPNSFTPNSDGLNDEFKVYGDGLSIIKMTIYDRWGKELYFKEGDDAMWNGTYKGEMCEEGVYIYRFLYRAISGQKIYKAGSITLLKD
ncbi:MAG: gliding motility-associated C-terminal domain-containing protein [Bacteroidota bacterium]|nr:gliding motility-associated C-terminal domain-containing protein [Bacteroidota bacterium]